MRCFKIGNKLVGEGQPTFIIAEAGSNHNGDLDQAKRLIDAAKEIGADAVKFQSFTAETIAVPKVIVDGESTEFLAYPVFEKYSLPKEWHGELAQYAKAVGIIFLSTPFDEAGVDLLDSIGVPAFKVASGDLTHLPLLRYIAKKGKPVFLATGTGNLGEVEEAVEAVLSQGNSEIVLMHCVTNYPTRFEDANIRAMTTMAQAFGLPVGYSDHTPGIAVPLAATAWGACVLEKHFTFDRNLPGPDHSYALEVSEFTELVKGVRQLERAMGDGIKRPVLGEQENITTIARRSIYAKKDIKEGETVTTEHVAILRPFKGLEPKYLDQVLGRKASRDIKAFEPLSWGMLNEF